MSEYRSFNGPGMHPMDSAKLWPEAHHQPFLLQRAEMTFNGVFACCETSSYQNLLPQVEQILSPEELNYFLPLPAERRKISFLCGRFVAKVALASLGKERELSGVRISTGIFNQPVVSRTSAHPVHVSISHSDNLACAAAFPLAHPLALDVEQVDPKKTDIMASQSHPDELKLCADLGVTRDASATLLWTAKEGISKVLQTGMTAPFEIFRINKVECHSTNRFTGFFSNFAQYKFEAWHLGSTMLTFVLPKRTHMQLDGNSPALPKLPPTKI
jgi:4'-phosphopantetheinyl transferase